MDDTMRQSAAVARGFVRLHAGWITSWLRKKPGRDPASANVKLHVGSASFSKDGHSSGAAFVGR